MIIDCDTHFMPLNAFDRMPGKFASLRPVIKLNDHGVYAALDFPGRHQCYLALTVC